MLRKTYRLMQKTRDMAVHAAEHFFEDAPKPTRAPLDFVCCPPGFIMGDAARGRDLVRFALDHTPEKLILLMGPQGDHHLDPNFHNFVWLTDLWAEGSANAMHAAARLVTAWMTAQTDRKSSVFSNVPTALRVIYLIRTYGFFMPAMTPESHSLLLTAVAGQKNLLRVAAKGRENPLEILHAACGYTIACVALGESSVAIDTGLQAIVKAAHDLIRTDGGPLSRRPSDLAPSLFLVLNIRDMLEAAGLSFPAELAHLLDRMVAALKFFDKGGGRLAVFHGGRCTDPLFVLKLLSHANLDGCAPFSLSQTGYERLCAGPSCLVMDTSPKEEGDIFSSLSAFEFSHAGQDIFVNCGPHIRDKTWQDLLGATAAHTAFVLDESDNTPMRGTTETKIARMDDQNGACLELFHTGYVPRNGFTHTRRVFLSSDGMDLRGEDNVTADTAPLSPLPYAIRFHVHPSVHVSPVSNGGAAALHLPDGKIFYLHQDGNRMTVEDSVYLAETGLPQKTKQIVISGEVLAASHTIHWALRAE